MRFGDEEYVGNQAHGPVFGVLVRVFDGVQDVSSYRISIEPRRERVRVRFLLTGLGCGRLEIVGLQVINGQLELRGGAGVAFRLRNAAVQKLCDIRTQDRKSVVWGKSVALGGRRIIKTKKKKNNTSTNKLPSTSSPA